MDVDLPMILAFLIILAILAGAMWLFQSFLWKD